MAAVRNGGWGWVALSLALGIATTDVNAQAASGVVTGQVIERESREPMAAVSVQLKRSADSTLVSTTSTSPNGRFRLGGIPEGSYFLEASSLGHGMRATAPFRIDEGRVYDVGTVELSVEAVSLDPIQVVSGRPAVAFEADRTAYLMDGLPAAEGGTITDALRTLPELDVDIDGNVELRGERPAIWVNGRPAPVSGQSLMQFLEHFPADLIDRIEVIDNPSSEFDAEGTGGVVNIVLKEGVDMGVSGSVFTSVDTRGNTGLGGRTTIQRGDWVWNGAASLRRRDSESDGFNLRQNLTADPTDFIQRDTWNANESLGANLSLRTTYTPRDEARFWLGADMSGQGGERAGLVTTTHMDERQDPFLRYDRESFADTEGRSLNLRTGFEWRWEPRHHFVDVELRYGRGHDRRESREELMADPGTDPGAGPFDLLPAELTLEHVDGGERDIRLDLRFRRPVGQRASVRMGYSFRDEASENQRLLTLIEPDAREETQRGFERTQRFNSAYLTMQRSFGERLVIQAGLRAEHVDWELELPTADPIAGRYLDVFPSVNASWSFERGRRVRLSYSQRIGRPSVHILDPTDRSTDPLVRSVGNPDIEPRYTHRVNLHASWSGSLGTLSAGPHVSRTVNSWERITTLDASGVSTRTWDNLSSVTNTGASVTWSFRDVAGWRGSANFSGSRSYRDADNLDPRYSGASARWNARWNLNGPLYGGLSAQTSLRYRGSSQSVQGRVAARGSANVSLRYRFLDDRASVSLSLRDPFGLQSSESEIRDATVWEIRRSSQSSRSARLSISYAIGRAGSRPGR